MRFTYRSGTRVLDGYTIKRGVGQGGFGEVYFAVSDGGKEVALKLLRGHSDVELRGVANCLNLKHPNLVHVYDLRSDEHGDTWLVMEYVLGESMAQVIGRHPTGLPANLCREWFLSLCRAVGYLHDHGVVHRDLKPANIFIENGTLKVGDYGLCKSLNSSQKQTRTVGTVHYMAPEISTGNYNKQIDIYACGVILHEMLTGDLPFDGESDGEILMKHLTATPDLTRVPMAFRPVVAKALDKNPLRRYGSTAELARAGEAVGGEPAVAVPIPAAAIPVAPPPAPVAAPVAEASPAPPPAPAPVAAAVPTATPLPPPPPLPVARPAAGLTARDRLTDLTGALVKAPVVAVAAAVPYALVTQTTDPQPLAKLVLLTTLLTWAVVAGAGRLTYRAADTWVARLRLGLLGALVGSAAYFVDGWPTPRLAPGEPVSLGGSSVLGLFQLPDGTASVAARYLLYFGGVLAIGRWWRTAARDRKERVGLFPAVAAGFWAVVLGFLWPWQAGDLWGGALPVVLAAVAVQLVSPWTPPPPPLPRKLKFRPTMA
ncbi:MAG: serine/threonine-protein kinase [Gemmataceae bacterium]